MFNPEKMLGSLLRGSLSSGGGGNLLKGQIGMGLLGVALEAVEHFTRQAAAPETPGSPPPGPPPAPPGRTGMAPPPPPPAAPGPPPTVPPADRQKDAVLLIRAMVAAANADGNIDPEERRRILEKFRVADLSPEEQGFLAGELLNPASLDDLTGAAHSLELARQIYIVSLLTITVDSDVERAYLAALGEGLGLSAEDLRSIHDQLGLVDL